MNFKNSLHDMLGLIMSTVYAALATNVMLVVSCLPLVLGLLTTDPSRSWPALVATAPLCAPALAAAAAVFEAFSADTSTPVVRTFWRAWRAVLPRAAAVGALGAGLGVVAGVDVAAAWGNRVGAFAIPVLVTLVLVAVCVTLTALVALGSAPRARVRDVLRAAGYAAVRRWYLTVLSLFLLGLLAAVVAARPALGLGLALAPLLYVVWANTRYALRPALDPAGAVGAPSPTA
ncbi:ferredoxin-NADPH reductase [Luteimicrobium sp. DT211]|uniref:ferredoxin-NADPH reductase n=1 Tax=Luteimicrobium sp. DT211 TaxID=3393412 RepID=UPI003CF63E0A